MNGAANASFTFNFSRAQTHHSFIFNLQFLEVAEAQGSFI